MEQSTVLHIPNPSPFPMQLFFCGKASCQPAHSVSTHVRQNHLLHFITKGKGMFSMGGHIYQLHECQGFFIPPNTPVYYQADSDEPWEYFWIGIDGDGAEQFFSHLGLTLHTPIFEFTQEKAFTDLLQQMLTVSPDTFENKLKLQGLLFLFLAHAATCCSPISGNTLQGIGGHVGRAMLFIQENYQRPITIETIAEHVSLNRSYLSALFHKQIGQTIQNYLMNYRISRAADLLVLTEDSVHSIAYSCGYNDPLTFSKTFKKQKGLPPLAYRQQERKQYQP